MGILRNADYLNLLQCETLEGAPFFFSASQCVRVAIALTLQRRADLKLHLSSTDYGNFLQNEPSPLATTTIAEVRRILFLGIACAHAD